MDSDERAPRARRSVGLDKGQFEVPADFNDPLPEDLLRAFEGGDQDPLTDLLAVTVYVQLLNEGTDTWRPTQARPRGQLAFELMPTPNYDAEDEEWEFLPGTLVRCEERTLSCGRVLVAVERFDSQRGDSAR